MDDDAGWRVRILDLIFKINIDFGVEGTFFRTS